MYIKSEQADAFYSKTLEKFSQLGDVANVKAFKSFEQLLDDIAQKSKYKEGEMILNTDLKQINLKVRKCLDEFVNNILEGREEMKDERNNYDCINPLRTYTEHLFALTMKKLGSPHMPALFGEEVKGDVTKHSYKLNDLLKQPEYFNISVSDHYNRQRKKNADSVRSENHDLISTLGQKKGTLKDAATLVAEYQALKSRQDGHTAIWRLFHKYENAARTKLLEDMEFAIRKFVGLKIDVKKRDPLNFALTIDYFRADNAFEKAFSDKALSDRYEIPEDAFGYEATTMDRAMEQRAKTNHLFNDPEKNMQAQINRVSAEPECGSVKTQRESAKVSAHELEEKAVSVAPPLTQPTAQKQETLLK